MFFVEVQREMFAADASGLRLQRGRTTSGTGSYIVRPQGMVSVGKLDIEITNVTRNVTGKLRIKYKG